MLQGALTFLMPRAFHFTCDSILLVCHLRLCTLEVLWHFYPCIPHAVVLMTLHLQILRHTDLVKFLLEAVVTDVRMTLFFLPLFLPFVL